MSSERCERFEVALSSLIDGELEAAEAPVVVDHVADCAECRAFYRAARALDRGALSATAMPAAGPAPREIWDRIHAATARERSRSVRRHGWPAWAAAAAAVVVLAIASWQLVPRGAETPSDSTPSGHLEVVLGHDRGAMTDQRFVELAAELMRADGRYHEKMHEVLGVILRHSQRSEGTRETGRGLPRREDELLRSADRPSEIGGAELAAGGRL